MGLEEGQATGKNGKGRNIEKDGQQHTSGNSLEERESVEGRVLLRNGKKTKSKITESQNKV